MNELPWSAKWLAWRLDREDRKDTWDSGLGAEKTGGRWNPKGRSVVYASADPSTAILEVAVHIGFRSLNAVPYVLTCFEIPDQDLIHIVQPDAVPNQEWLTNLPASAAQQAYGDDLLASHPFILIPSVVSRHSWNLLVSCDLAKGQYRMISQERFGLDGRLVSP